MMCPASSIEYKRLGLLASEWRYPQSTTVTPALWLARLVHLKRRMGKSDSVAGFQKVRPQSGTCKPWHMEFVDTNAAVHCVRCAVISGLQEPSGNIVERFPISYPLIERDFKICLLLVLLPCANQVGRIPANISFPAFIFKINLRLFQRRTKKDHRRKSLRLFRSADKRSTNQAVTHCRKRSS